MIAFFAHQTPRSSRAQFRRYLYYSERYGISPNKNVK